MNTAAIVIPIVVVVVLLVLLGLYLLTAYRSLVQLRERVDEAWRDIGAQVQHRAELVPAIVRSVRGYAADDRTTFDAVERARAETLEARDPERATAAEHHMQQALRSVYAVAQTYPQLSASQDFLQLQGELVETEDRIQSSRRFYNGGVRELNGKIQVFPNNLLAKRAGAQQREFFEVGGSAVAEPPRIQF